MGLGDLSDLLLFGNLKCADHVTVVTGGGCQSLDGVAERSETTMVTRSSSEAS